MDEIVKHKIKHTIMGAITFSFYSDEINDVLLEKITDFTHDVLYYYRHNYARQQSALIDKMYVNLFNDNITFSVNQKYLCKGVKSV